MRSSNGTMTKVRMAGLTGYFYVYSPVHCISICGQGKSVKLCSDGACFRKDILRIFSWIP